MKQLTTTQVLEKARHLVRTPRRWVQGMHSGVHGVTRCFCVFGAVYNVRKQLSNDAPEWVLLKRASIELFGTTPVSFNDRHDTTHGDVLRLFDRAIALSKETP